MITVKELTKRYARNTAVDHISFEIQKGQIVGFLGPNGAGKTTTMRMLTCFLPPTAGTATVAGFDVLEEPMEVKKRIDYVSERCAIADVRNKQLGKLSKGYRQRVGLAQAIIHNPEVLILDEPTAGLDPKQINETRDLIKSLAGDHTIILSTHILPEVEQICQQVIIISKGKLVATDTVDNLQNRASGAESVLLEVAGRKGELDTTVVQARIGKVPGVNRIVLKQKQPTHSTFEVETQKDRFVRGDLARAIVEAGWDLNEMRSAAVSLEEVFLQLTGTQESAPKEEVVVAGAGK